MASALSVFITPIHPLIVTKNKNNYSYYHLPVAPYDRTQNAWFFLPATDAHAYFTCLPKVSKSALQLLVTDYR